MTTGVSELTAHLGFWLRMVSNHVSHAFSQKLAEQDVTVAEWCLMRGLYGVPPTAPSRLAQNLTMTRGAVTKLADRLIAKGLVVRAASASDRRAQTLSLTARGATLLPRLAELADRNDAEFFDVLTAAERAELDALLRRLVQQNRIAAVPTD